MFIIIVMVFIYHYNSYDLFLIKAHQMIEYRLLSEEVRHNSEEDGHDISATEIYYCYCNCIFSNAQMKVER